LNCGGAGISHSTTFGNRVSWAANPPLGIHREFCHFSMFDAEQRRSEPFSSKGFVSTA
jgi:hypothetical protein